MIEANDDRLKKEMGVASRRSRALDDRTVTEDREMTEDDRLEMFRMQQFADALPDLPNIPGYHMCWLSTTNGSDPIARRIRLGYTPVRAEDVPGFEYASQKTGEWAGCVGINEMLAFKLPLSLYEKFMQEAHHNAPNREEGKLADTANFLRDQLRSAGSAIYEGDGMQELHQAAPARGRFD
jgi:hypothetical protein